MSHHKICHDKCVTSVTISLVLHACFYNNYVTSFGKQYFVSYSLFCLCYSYLNKSTSPRLGRIHLPTWKLHWSLQIVMLFTDSSQPRHFYMIMSNVVEQSMSIRSTNQLSQTTLLRNSRHLCERSKVLRSHIVIQVMCTCRVTCAKLSLTWCHKNAPMSSYS